MDGAGGGRGGSVDTKKQLYQRIHNRLSTATPFADVRYVPSRIRPRRLVADVDAASFGGGSYPASTARLEIEFLLREDWDRYWIQWIEPERDLACGWHQDGTHPGLGTCHFQVEFPDGTTSRESAEFLDAHPLAVVERRLAELPERLRSLAGDGRMG